MNMEPEQIPKELFQPAGPQQQPVLPRSVGGRRAAAWGRFRKNGSSVVAVVVLALLLAFALIVPMVMPYGVEFRDGYYKNALPKWEALAFLGWDGCQEVTVNQATYDYYKAMGAVKQVKEKNVNATTGRYTYRVLVDAYAKAEYRGNLLDLLEPGYGPVLAPYVIDNDKFPADWFEQTSRCSKKCEQCTYCKSVLEQVLTEG